MADEQPQSVAPAQRDPQAPLPELERFVRMAAVTLSRTYPQAVVELAKLGYTIDSETLRKWADRNGFAVAAAFQKLDDSDARHTLERVCDYVVSAMNEPSKVVIFFGAIMEVCASYAEARGVNLGEELPEKKAKA